MSSYSEAAHETVCPACNTNNHVLVAYAGDYRANEREPVDCYRCGATLESEKCWAIFSAGTAEEAVVQLRRTQNRA